jgi:molybdopterin/thiamine biosynthesis adenylyltransferase
LRILFCGVGALGSHAAVLCRGLPVELSFVDFDRVESKNVQAQVYARQSIGRNKADALRLQLLNYYGTTSEAYPVRLEPANVDALVSPVDLLVDCFDNAKSRMVLSDGARRLGKPLVHAAISADGTFGIVRWDEQFTPDAEDEAGQATCEAGEHLPFIGLVGGAVAGVIRDFVSGGHQRDLMIASSGVTTTHVGSRAATLT